MTDITEDDRQTISGIFRDWDGRDDNELRAMLALALAETRERAEAQVGEIMMQQATRIDALEAENARLDGGWKDCQEQGRRLRDRLAIFQRNAGLATTEDTS